MFKIEKRKREEKRRRENNVNYLTYDKLKLLFYCYISLVNFSLKINEKII
jgi:hypothetical protein